MTTPQWAFTIDRTKTSIISSIPLSVPRLLPVAELSSDTCCSSLCADLCSNVADKEVSVGTGRVRLGLSPGILVPGCSAGPPSLPVSGPPHVFPVFSQTSSAVSAHCTRAGAFSWGFVWPGLWEWLKFRCVWQHSLRPPQTPSVLQSVQLSLPFIYFFYTPHLPFLSIFLTWKQQIVSLHNCKEIRRGRER